ncbi:hypothetical protein D3C72_1895670 [compost metagenome]
MIANLYKYIEDLGESIITVKKSYDLELTGKVVGVSLPTSAANTALNNVINDYNDFLKRPDIYRYGNLDANINKSLTSYYQSLDKLKEIDAFIKTAPNKLTQSDLTNYAVLETAFNNSINLGLNLSRNGFTTHIYNAIK